MADKQVKYAYNDDEDYVPTKRVKYSEKDDIIVTEKKKHTLDSDEEDNDADEAVKYDVNDEDMDGQEEATVDFEGETKITPFNMKEEMEEGHFDQDGFYHFKKDGDQLKDAWLDNIDWAKVKRKDDETGGSDSDSEPELPAGDSEKQLINIYEQIIAFLKEGETIAKALKRLGNKTKRISTAERWKLKKLGKTAEDSSSDMTSCMRLTELCNEVIETGYMDIYEETYEMVTLKIQRSKKSEDKEPTLDMFGEVEQGSTTLTENKIDSEAKDTFEEVAWEYKKVDEETIHGPFNTEKMVKFQESGEFKSGSVHVRKTGVTDAPWYQGSRMDFSIYL